MPLNDVDARANPCAAVSVGLARRNWPEGELCVCELMAGGWMTSSPKIGMFRVRTQDFQACAQGNGFSTLGTPLPAVGIFSDSLRADAIPPN